MSPAWLAAFELPDWRPEAQPVVPPAPDDILDLSTAQIVLSAQSAPSSPVVASPIPVSQMRPSTPVAAPRSSKGRLKKFWNKPVTRGSRISWSLAAILGCVVIPGVVNQVDKNSGGAIMLAAGDAALNSIIAGYHAATDTLSDAEKRAWIARKINEVQSVQEFLQANPMWLFGLNKAVESAFANSGGDPEAAKKAAIEYQLTRVDILAVKMAARSLILRETEPRLSQPERNKMLAEGFVEDILQDADCKIMRDKGIKITEQDIRALLRQHSDFINSIPGGDGLRSGLIALYPELKNELRTGENPGVSTAEALKKQQQEFEAQLAAERAAAEQRAREAAEAQRRMAEDIKKQKEESARQVAVTVGIWPMQRLQLNYLWYNATSEAYHAARCGFVIANAKAKGLNFDPTFCYAIKDLNL